jgi:hypothetical protein
MARSPKLSVSCISNLITKYCTVAAFFLLAKFRQKAIFFYLWPILVKFGPQKNILVAKFSSILTIFIHLNPFSSIFRAFIQHPDELTSGYVIVVPPGRKTKNHRKNTGTVKICKDL